MAIAHDTATRFPATDGPSGTNSVDTTTGDRTFSHAGAAGAKGAVVVLNCTGTTSVVTGVLYGGTAMSLDTSITDTSEAGRVEIWVLGDLTGLGGTQTVTLQGCTATGKWATCSTVTAATSLVKVHQRGSLGDATLDTTRQLTLVTTVTTMSYCGVHQGNAAPGTNVATGNTLQYQNDYGALSSMSARRTSADAAGSIVVGFNAAAASDDRCIAAVALQEYTPKTTAASIAETPAESTWTGTGTSKSTSTGGNGSGTVSWQSGDIVYVFGATAQASSTTLGTPTHAGANLPAFAAVGAVVGAGSQCWAHTWSATATGSGSSVISETADSSSDPWGIIAWVVRGSDGTGTRASDVSATKTVSLTRSDAHSLVFEIIADYAAGSATLTWTPSGQTQREATQSAGLYTVGVADWGDQGSAGATSYGVSAGFDATGPLTKIALEILGTVTSGTNYTETPADTEGLTDTQALDQGKAHTHTLGLTDARAFDQDKTLPVETLGLTDTVAAQFDRPATDTLELTDTTERVLGREVAQTDTLGLADEIQTEQSKAAAPTDTLGLTDAIATVGNFVRDQTDDLGLTDSLTISGDRTFEQTDTLGLTDAAATVGDFQRGITDSLGVTDSTVIDVGKLVSQIDTLGLTDSRTVDQDKVRAETVGLTDTLAFVIEKALVDEAVVNDAVAIVAAYERSLLDTLGLTDLSGVGVPQPDLNPLRVTITEHSFAVTFTEAAAVTYTEPTNAFVYQEGG